MSFDELTRKRGSKNTLRYPVFVLSCLFLSTHNMSDGLHEEETRWCPRITESRKHFETTSYSIGFYKGFTIGRNRSQLDNSLRTREFPGKKSISVQLSIVNYLFK
jgi:hypothetical protein